jgi:hypothetical protein
MRLCYLMSCSVAVHAKGLCSKHYSQMVRGNKVSKSWTQVNQRNKGVTGRCAKGLTYNSWRNMKQRCTNPRNPAYKYYGGKGITVCKPWLNYQSFVKDMGQRPPGTSIDRINNRGNYEPGNCSWENAYVQAANKEGGLLDKSAKALNTIP